MNDVFLNEIDVKISYQLIVTELFLTIDLYKTLLTHSLTKELYLSETFIQLI